MCEWNEECTSLVSNHAIFLMKMFLPLNSSLQFMSLSGSLRMPFVSLYFAFATIGTNVLFNQSRAYVLCDLSHNVEISAWLRMNRILCLIDQLSS